MSRSLVCVALVSALLLSACKAKTAEGSERLAKAQTFLGQQDSAQALAEVKIAIGLDPRSKAAHLLAAQILEHSGDPAQAIVEYGRADLLDPNDRTARFKLIGMLVAENHLDAALGRINATLGDDPNSLDALAYRALVESRQGKAAKARVDASRVVAAKPGNPVANAALADLALRDKDAVTALKAIDRGLAIDPADTTLLQLQASAFAMQHAIDKAVAIEQKLVAATPKAPSYRLALAELQAVASIDAGEATLRDGVAAAPDNQQMRLQLVAYLIRHGNAAAADTALKDAIASAPDGSTYDLVLAGQTAGRGKVDDAIAILRIAIDRTHEAPARIAAQLGLARLLAGTRNIGEARSVLDDILKADPNNDVALMQRADLLTRTGDPARAASDLLAVATRQPANPAPFGLLASAYLRMGKGADAVDALKRIADLNPTDLDATLRVVDLEGSLGRTGEAKAAIDDFVHRNPDSIEGRVAAIRFGLVNKDLNGAQGALASLQRLPGTERVGLEWSGQLKEAQGATADAAAIYKRLIATQDPGRFNTALALAFVRASLAAKQGREAVAVLTAFDRSKAGGDSSAIDLTLAALYRELADDGKADDATEAAIREAPHNPAGYLAKAATLARARKPDQAIATLDAALAEGVSRDPLLSARATIETDMGDTGAAIATYRTIMATHPDAILAVNNFASLLADRKPLDKAELATARDRLRDLATTETASILDTLAWADYRLGDFASAKTLLERAQAGTSQSAQIRFHYGAVLVATGEKDSGRSIIKAVLDQTFPGQDEAEHLLAQ